MNPYLTRCHRWLGLLACLLLPVHSSLFAAEPQTERVYLSGQGPDDAKLWGFQINHGRRAGEAAQIRVPSNWETQGFGSYRYGQTPSFQEQGQYQLRFAVPEAWKGQRIRLVFDGVMTDATVRVNGKAAGPTHIGGFYRFGFDVTGLVKLGAQDNLLEVDVERYSSNARTAVAEGGGDYWTFGGIFRPVWLETAPVEAIEHVAIDAKADGSLRAVLRLDSVQTATQIEGRVFDTQGHEVGAPFSVNLPRGGRGSLSLSTRVESPRLWTGETPNLYTLKLKLLKGDTVLHTASQRFGFRTFEVRAGDGLYLNGQRILLKGVNRHAFRPEQGRTLTREQNYEDVRLIRQMNMNAVRMSHYSPDEAFLEACDELGLYVIDELSGWQNSHDTFVGRVLVRELVERDVNHPSILFWDNGNEGGWNRDLDGDFALYDPQQRTVLHPWELHDGVNTKHYPRWDQLTELLKGPDLVMPTEMLHALYDGGGGAALQDYWNAITKSPVGAGGFIWALVDESVRRDDEGGRIDSFATYAPDGLVGPHYEKKGSFFTVRELFSPVQIATPTLDAGFDGRLKLRNDYDFSSLTQAHFDWQLLRYADPSERKTTPRVLSQGSAPSPAIAPHSSGELALKLPGDWAQADALALTAKGPDGESLWTWTWPTAALPERLAAETTKPSKGAAPRVETQDGEIRLIAGNTQARFDASTGLLLDYRRGTQSLALRNGPRLVYARPAAGAELSWWTPRNVDGRGETWRLDAPQTVHRLELDFDVTKRSVWLGYRVEISADGERWQTLFDGRRRPTDGQDFVFPPQTIAAVRVSGVHEYENTPIKLKSLRLGYAASRFAPAPSAAQVSQGTGVDEKTGGKTAWLESTGGNLQNARWVLHADGRLQLDYAYTLSGPVLYHGISFDQNEAALKTLRWLGQGPYRVWQNRLQGTTLGVHEIARNDNQPGQGWSFPEFHGYFGGLRWASIDDGRTRLTLRDAAADHYLRIGTPRPDHPNTTVEFPAGDLSVLAAINAAGTKFNTPERSGPSSQATQASGTYRGSLSFTLDAVR